MSQRTSIRLAALMIALAVVLGFSSARADTFGTLFVGPNYTTNPISGGSIDPSTWTPLNGTTESLAFLYCIDVPDDVVVNESYANTLATTTGYVTMSIPNKTVTSSPYQDDAPLINVNGDPVAGQVAWLLDNYGIGGQNTLQVVGLQEAIWYEIYGQYDNQPVGSTAVTDLDNLYGCGATGCYADTSNAPKVGNVSGYLWFSPGDNPNSPNQALVGRVPDGGMTLMLLGGALIGLETLRRKLRV